MTASDYINRPDFGLDVHAQPGLSWRQVSGLENLATALMRRLSTPRGALFYDLSYGTDLRSYLNKAYNDRDRAIVWEIEQRATSEVLKDERVYDATATFELSDVQGRTGRLVLTIVTGLGSFRLVLSADQVNSEVLKVEVI